MTKLIFTLLISVGMAACKVANAAPYEPIDDNTILATSVAKNFSGPRPNKLISADAADQLARQYLRQTQLTGDARFVGYAQAALQNWLNDANNIQPHLLVTVALIKQHLHDFSGAVKDLDRAIALVPDDMQARLTRASLLQLRGDFDAAREDCRSLLGMNVLVAYTCQAGSARSDTEVTRVYEVLTRLLQQTSTAEENIVQWSLQALAILAERRGEYKLALQSLAQAKAIGPADITLSALYCDALLKQGKASEALSQLDSDNLAEPLLLRKILTLQALELDASASIKQLQDRFDAEKTRDDQRHLREEAIYELRVLKRSDVALALARRNWLQQKEPIDTQLLLEAAQFSGSKQDIALIRNWIKEQNYYDADVVAQLAREGV